MPNHLKDGNWISLTSRNIRQGLDLINIDIDKKTGIPKGIMTTEVKYGSSQLGTTKDGRQASKNWVNSRIAKKAQEYFETANAKVVSIPHHEPNFKLDITLPNNKKTFFWKDGTNDQWKYAGDAKDLKLAKQRAFTFGKFFNGAVEGKIGIRSRILRIKIDNNDIVYSLRNADNFINDIRKETFKIREFRIKDFLNKSAEEFEDEIYKQLKNKIGGDDTSLRKQAKELAKLSNRQILEAKKINPTKEILKKSVSIGMISTLAIDSSIQLSTNNFDPKLTALYTGSSGAYILTEKILKYRIIKKVLDKAKNSNFFAKLTPNIISKSITPTASRIVNASTCNMIAVSALISYGKYYMGYSDLKEANREMIASSIGVMTGSAASMGTMGLIGAFATASTGSAISSLSGVAATNATLAWLGGGTIASGGLGVAGGTAILSGGTIIIAVATTYAIYVIYDKYDQIKQREELESYVHNLDNLLSDENIAKLVEMKSYEIYN